jgi:hypothetical protein
VLSISCCCGGIADGSCVHGPGVQIYSTLGGLDNLRTARKHYAHSIELNKTRNLRAYLALVACTKSIAAHRSYRADQDDDGMNERLQQFALDFVQQYYASEASPELAAIGASSHPWQCP